MPNENATIVNEEAKWHHADTKVDAMEIVFRNSGYDYPLNHWEKYKEDFVTQFYYYDSELFCYKKLQYDYMKLLGRVFSLQGDLDGLEWLHKRNYVFNEHDIAFTAQNGHLNCLQYLHELGCEWTGLTCTFAAWFGHLHCLQYMHENGCPIENIIPEKVHPNCMQYLFDNGCPGIHTGGTYSDEQGPVKIPFVN